MELDRVRLLQAMRRKGVNVLCHANSVRTSSTFLREGGLFSRGAVEDRGLEQTDQTSDQGDRDLGLWHDIFLDGIDIHTRYGAGARNEYGPVLFMYSVNLLSEPDLPPVWVIKSRINPLYWPTSMPMEDRYYQSVEEFEAGYQYGDYKSITLRGAHDPLPFEPHLIKVLVDQPRRLLDGVDLHEVAMQALTEAAKDGGVDADKIRVRDCSGCRCQRQYESLSEYSLRQLFLPKADDS
jgi:hypothetical protein